MVSKANWKTFAILGVVAALFVCSGGLLMASNMGFKLNKFIQNNQTGAGPKADNWVSIPYNSPYTNFTQLCNAFVTTNKLRITISRIDPVTGTFTNVNCLAGSAVALDGAVGLRVRVVGTIAAESPSNVVLVGASNETKPWPNIIGSFSGSGPKGDNWVSIPYHTTMLKANEICTLAGIPALTNGTVSRIDPTTGTFTNFPCGSPVGSATNFSIVIGEAYRIRKNTAGTTVGALPPHF
jgi:hypothetical protein